MIHNRILEMRRKHVVLAELSYEPTPLLHGYTDKVLRVDATTNTFRIVDVPPTMKELWTGGKGYDLWLMFQEINKNTRWDSPENVICFSSGPLGGTASFPGSGKTLCTTVSPATGSIMDANVGGYFGPYLKFAGFDALVLAGKADEEIIVVIDVPNGKITIEKAPDEAVDAHVVCEELTEMYADNEDDKRNIAVVAAGSASDHIWMGVLNFSFYDWRRKVARIKQAGRGGMGAVFRNKKFKALVIKNKFFTPSWTIAEQPFADEFKFPEVTPERVLDKQGMQDIISRWNSSRDHVVEMLLEAQARQGCITRDIIDDITNATGTPKSHLYHIVTFYPVFSLTPTGRQTVTGEPPAGIPILHGETILSSFGAPDPENINNAMKQGAYDALAKTCKTMTPDAIIQAITESGLRGRGGSGFPTGIKWRTAADAAAQQKKAAHVVCNADDSGPGASIDRTIIESNPHGVIEGIIIGARAVGATEGHIFIRKEYKTALDRLEKALVLARSKGFLGPNILGIGFDFDIRIHQGAGAFVNGEATAVIQSMSGRAGEPVARYVHLTETGFKGAPTVVNNVETWVNIPAIISRGAAWFAGIGAVDAAGKRIGTSTGTKVFALSGAVNRAGLVEVPMGTTLRTLIETYGGGVAAGKRLQAVHIGGPSGGFLPPEKLDMPLDFEPMAEAGCIMGTGDILVIDSSACLISLVASFTKYLAAESCGKCTPCREGLQQIHAVVQRIRDGKGTDTDPVFLEELADTIRHTSLCSFGGTAGNPVLSSLRYFRDRYDKHIKTGKCPSDHAEVR
ncbi:NAD(P)H-dependent oxidoreductase subunit E [bacterium]|nr:NAD(P)H-dependent oxidoreductase subunit E [candidate division CSSED10-310 bacterium]